MLLDLYARLLRKKHDYRTVYATPEGRRVIADLIRFSGVMKTPIQVGSPDGTGMLIGMQRVGHRIIKILGMSEAEMARLSEQPQEADYGDS